MTTEIFIFFLLLSILSISLAGYGYYRLREFDKSLDELLKVSNECATVCREMNTTVKEKNEYD